MTTKTQERVAKVLTRMLEMVNANDDDAEMFSDGLEDMLTEIASNDGFGTEMQCDPRGDGRDGEWHMDRVQGID